ncbi:MAG: prenyltransferase [Bacteroidales bacterium]|nr:prenyltransferase [Bacteroidales bacterium]
MDKPGGFQVWMAQIRAPFLILAVLLVAIGLALAYKLPVSDELNFNGWHALLLVIGVVSSHISVNLFNEYSDHKTKIDFYTQRSPFSGGSGMLTQGFTKPGIVLAVAIITLFLSFAIGIYFTIVSHWAVMALSIIGGLTIIFYTEGLTKILLGELLAGLTLGSFVVIGTYIAMTATPDMTLGEVLPIRVILYSISPGILTILLLLINEFPDREADKAGGRFHLVIKLGTKGAAVVYTIGMILTFGTILAIPLLGLGPFWVYLALLPVPLAIKACNIALKHGDDMQKLVPALGSNIITVLATDLLIVISILVGVF